jgi:hypothetical protein
MKLWYGAFNARKVQRQAEDDFIASIKTLNIFASPTAKADQVFDEQKKKVNDQQ